MTAKVGKIVWRCLFLMATVWPIIPLAIPGGGQEINYGHTSFLGIFIWEGIWGVAYFLADRILIGGSYFIYKMRTSAVSITIFFKIAFAVKSGFWGLINWLVQKVFIK